jgi:NIMA (never in mitosis gene a)-related kinase
MHSLSDKEKENAINEVRILASVKDINVIAYKEAFYDS